MFNIDGGDIHVETLIDRSDDAGAVRALLDAGYRPDGNARADRGSFSPLSHAVSMKRKRIVRLLLEYGADMHASFFWGGSDCLLADAMYKEDAAQAAMLVANGANANHEHALNDCLTFMSWFDIPLTPGHCRAARVIIDAGADLGRRPTGTSYRPAATPLELASRVGYRALTETLAART